MTDKFVKIKLNENMGRCVQPYGFKLDPKKKYIINLDDEMDIQKAILSSIECFGVPAAMKDYFDWLNNNDFQLCPTNEFVSKFYGKKPLWETCLSQGIAVKNFNDDDYYIVLECSRENPGYKYTQIIVTLGGCE